MYVCMYICMTSAFAGGEWSPRPGRFIPGTHWIAGLVGPSEGLHAVKNKFLTLPRLELRPLNRVTRSQPPYRMGYPTSSASIKVHLKTCEVVSSSDSDVSRYIAYKKLLASVFNI
jgi:hypothetical protein